MNWTKPLIIIVVILVVLYGGYKLFKSMGTSYTVPRTATVTQPAAMSPSPEATGGNSVYKMMTSSTLGSYLTDPKGMTLYVFAKDNPGTGTSNCSGGCLATWPAFMATSSTGPFPANITVFKRTDGTWQYAWKGWPLYYYSGDTKAGDTNGQGIGGVWSVAK